LIESLIESLIEGLIERFIDRPTRRAPEAIRMGSLRPFVRCTGETACARVHACDRLAGQIRM
jgi:hypothetical protein